MSCPDRLSSWKQEVSTSFAHSRLAQVLGLVYWSVGIALTGSSGISQISASRGPHHETERRYGLSTSARVVSGCGT